MNFAFQNREIRIHAEQSARSSLLQKPCESQTNQANLLGDKHVLRSS
jgi:hypothetical protein